MWKAGAAVSVAFRLALWREVLKLQAGTYFQELAETFGKSIRGGTFVWFTAFFSGSRYESGIEVSLGFESLSWTGLASDLSWVT